MDMVTPLKKRRLANYKEDTENEEQLMDSLTVGDTSPPVTGSNAVHGSPSRHVPNGLKKQILQNLVLEAVLDKAMEDMLSEPTAVNVFENLSEGRKSKSCKIWSLRLY